ncbi:MAG: hypothetical protein ACO1OB_07355 [Archangium sp.]
MASVMRNTARKRSRSSDCNLLSANFMCSTLPSHAPDFAKCAHDVSVDQPAP